MIKADVERSGHLLLTTGCRVGTEGLGVDEVPNSSDTGSSIGPVALLDFFFFVILRPDP